MPMILPLNDISSSLESFALRLCCCLGKRQLEP